MREESGSEEWTIATRSFTQHRELCVTHLMCVVA